MASVSYDPCTGVFTRLRAQNSKRVGQPITRTNGKTGYIRVSVDGEWYYAHRLAWFITHGCWPSQSIDHINGDPSDNRLENLREATPSQNGANRSRPSRSRLRGVTIDSRPRRKPFVAQIKHAGVHYYLGRYETEEDAHRAFSEAAARMHGEFARFD